MKGHLGAVLTSGLAAVALALAVLQAAILFHSAPQPYSVNTAGRVQSNRYSTPAGRSGVPYMPFEKAPAPAPPATPEGRTPGKQQEERHTPPPPRQRNLPFAPGPRPARRAVA